MCTKLTLEPARDGAVVVGRSMEFPNVLPYSLAVLPTGYEGVATASDSTPGKTWTGPHGMVGIAAVKQAIGELTIWGHDPGMGGAPPGHFFVHDSTAPIAIEFHHDASVHVVDNPTGVGTNAPYLDWHL